MAIQISEKHLSPQAKKALNNAKNKSQFLRDAIEYYVNSEISNNKNKKLLESLQLDVKEIKELLLKISFQGKTVMNNEEEHNQVKKTKKQKETETYDNRITSPKGIKISNEENGLTEEEKREIEKLLDNSLDLF